MVCRSTVSFFAHTHARVHTHARARAHTDTHERAHSTCNNGAMIADCTTEPHGNCTDYPSKLFNHMIQPFVGFGLRAILWYQVSRNLLQQARDTTYECSACLL